MDDKTKKRFIKIDGVMISPDKTESIESIYYDIDNEKIVSIEEFITRVDDE